MESSVVMHPNPVSDPGNCWTGCCTASILQSRHTTGMGFVQWICVYNALLYLHCYRNQTSVVSSKFIAIFQCLMSFRLLEHAPAYYELGSFPDSEMKRALQNLERRRPEDSGRKVKKQKKILAWFPKPSSFSIPCFLDLLCSPIFARVVLSNCFR